jgi:hypothetical protein
MTNSYVAEAELKPTRSSELKLSMGRLATVALATAALSTGACAMDEGEYVGSGDEELSALLTGTPEGICVEFGQVTNVLVQVKDGWTNSDAIELDINITGTNGDPNIQHGQAVVPVSAGSVFDGSRDLAMISIEWDDPNTVIHDFETIYVDIQVLAGGHELGEVQSADFLPGTYGSCL